MIHWITMNGLLVSDSSILWLGSAGATRGVVNFLFGQPRQGTFLRWLLFPLLVAGLLQFEHLGIAQGHL